MSEHEQEFVADNLQWRRLELLHRASLAFNASLDLDEIFHRVLEEVNHALRANGWAVWVLDDSERELTCQQAAGPGSENLLGFTIPRDLPLLQPVIRDAQSVYVPDTTQSPLFDGRVALQRNMSVRSFMSVPLSSPEPTGSCAAVGLITVISESPDAFSTDDRALMDALAASASGAIRNAQLYRQARQEIAERRRAESALRESEGHYRTLVETSPDAVLLVDLQGRIQICNRRALELFGYSHTYQLLGRTYLTLFPPGARPRAIQGYESVRQGVTLRDAESTLLRRDGTLFEGEIAAALAASNNGQPASVVVFARDITARKAAETAIRRHNEELRVLNDIATSISKTQSLSQVLETALDKALNAMEIDTGWIVLFDESPMATGEGGPEILLRKGILSEPRLEERTRAFRHQVEHAVCRSHEPVVEQSAGIVDLSSSPSAPCLVVGVPLISGSTVIGVMGAVGLKDRHLRNLQERQVQLLSAVGYQVSIAVENTRLSAQAAEVEMLRELERMRSELIANFSHDLRTPLGLIEMSTSTLLRDDIALDATLRDDILRDVMTQTGRLSHMVEGILDLGRLESGRLRLNRIPVDIGQLIGRVSQEMRKLYVDHRFLIEIPDDPLMAIADPDRIEQVLYNLLDNAAKYSPQGGDIGVRGQSASDTILVRVTDFGIGIPADQLALVFERYYRLNDTATEGVPGVGLGLPTCQGIINAHDGEIWVESVYGAGSTFSFTLPAAPGTA